MADTISIRRDPEFDSDLETLSAAYSNPTAAVKDALHELAEKHRYWKRVDDVITELEAEGYSGTADTDAWAAKIFT